MDKTFSPPYAWQLPSEVEFYVKRAADLVASFGSYFDRVRKFVPIGPNLRRQDKIPFLSQRVRNLHHRISSRVNRRRSWYFSYIDYEARYQKLLDLRDRPLEYDVVLLDTLWAWPRHRRDLHKCLHNMSDRYEIHSRLNWSDPRACDGSDIAQLDRDEFPMTTGPVYDFEEMLASSRLGVFATGLHWGWRNVMTLALMVGLPVYSDRLIVEPWFDINGFHIHWNETADWVGLERILTSISRHDWQRIKLENQVAYDQVMSPEAVAQYFVNVALAR